ncbi:hypothetical protein FQB19_22170 [Salmonella enterica]|nr:hypothetical protein [Salmonella enterica]
MSETIKATIRLKKQEAIELKDRAYALTKKAIVNGKHIIYTESDLVHFSIEKTLKKIDLDDSGKLMLKDEKKKNQ